MKLGISYLSVQNFRPENQDVIFVDKDLNLFAIADGMGGEMEGKEAATIAVQALFDEIRALTNKGLLENWKSEGLSSTFEVVFLKISERIGRMVAGGTTLSFAHLMNITPTKAQMLIGHVGDSRVYRMRFPEMMQLTTDHNMAEQAPQFSNVLTSCLGRNGLKDYQVKVHTAKPGDVFLLATDGLWEGMEKSGKDKVYIENELFQVLHDSNRVDESCDALIKMALNSGSNDNISVLAIEIT